MTIQLWIVVAAFVVTTVLAVLAYRRRADGRWQGVLVGDVIALPVELFLTLLWIGPNFARHPFGCLDASGARVERHSRPPARRLARWTGVVRPRPAWLERDGAIAQVQ